MNLTKPIPVLIPYGTAVVDEEGRLHFFDDLHGHDAPLRRYWPRDTPNPG